jgi:hypothetical protein
MGLRHDGHPLWAANPNIVYKNVSGSLGIHNLKYQAYNGSPFEGGRGMNHAGKLLNLNINETFSMN